MTRRGTVRTSLPWLGLAAALLLLSQVGCQKTSTVSTAGDKQPGGPDAGGLPAELKLVPPDAAGFVHVRLADVWQDEALAEFRQLLSKAGPEALKAFDGRYAPAPSTIDRATLILLTPQALHDGLFSGDPEAFSPVLVLTFAQPYDKDQVLKALAPEGRVKKHQGHSYHFIEHTWSALLFPDDRNLVIGSEDAVVHWLVNRPKGDPADGPLQNALRAAAGKHHVVVGLNPPKVAEAAAQKQADNVFERGADAGAPKSAKQDLPPALKPLFEARCATITVDLGKAPKAEAWLHYDSDSQAAEGKKAVQAALDLFREKMQEPIRDAEKTLNKPSRRGHGASARQTADGPRALVDDLPDLPEKFFCLMGIGLLRHVDEVAKAMPVQQQGSTVQITCASPAGHVPTLLGAGAAITMLGKSANATFESVASTIGSTDGPGGFGGSPLQQVFDALEKYRAEHGTYPPAAIYDKDGQPLLSWRVALLPYLGDEGKALYKEFKLDEPWDGMHNKKLLKRMPKAFKGYSYYGSQPWRTCYQVFTGKGTVFDGAKGFRKEDITDGPENTILVVETDGDYAVAWSKPADLACDPERALPPFLGEYKTTFSALFADGSVEYLKKEDVTARLRAFLTPRGGEAIRRQGAP